MKRKGRRKTEDGADASKNRVGCGWGGGRKKRENAVGKPSGN